ncbi:bacterial transcriptional activator domain-containing protein [Streptomyces sp. NPDC001941]|uniref:AfsR/SARP family transcriptional regulator n=1 Tax=Streptomyces sp. NPDC001941 TaxID=3154659 RepID=UPI0033242153
MIRLIGLVTIEHDGFPPQHLSSAQAQVAFSRLILERSAGTSRDQLADTVWPDGLPDTWASALRSVVSRVRGYLTSPLQKPGETPLIAQSGRYVLRLPDDAAVDLEAAETSVAEAKAAFGEGAHAVAHQLSAAAVTNLRGSFLPAHEGEWVNGVRERVDELRLTSLELASLAASSLGDEHHAVRYADEAVRRAAFRESAHRCLMTAHSTAGNRAEALRAYHQLREVLADELGIDPAPETQRAYLDLLNAPEPAPPRRRPSPSRTPVDALDPVIMGAFEALTPPAR